MKTITISIDDNGRVADLRVGDKTTGLLTFGEAVELLAGLTLGVPKEPLTWLKTESERGRQRDMSDIPY